MKALCLLALILSSPQISFAKKLLEPELRFRYKSFDGQIWLDCAHKLEDANSRDYLVTCGSSAKKNYRVHLWLTQYDHTTEPKRSYELLYWITLTGQPLSPDRGHSHTTWFHLKDPTEISSIESSLGVDDETAGLYLEMKP